MSTPAATAPAGIEHSVSAAHHSERSDRFAAARPAFLARVLFIILLCGAGPVPSYGAATGAGHGPSTTITSPSSRADEFANPSDKSGPRYQSSYYRAKWTARLLSAALIPFGLVFLLGVYRGLRSLGGPGLFRDLRGEGASRLRRLVTYGLLQRRVLARPCSGSIHAAISWGFLVLFLGSLLILVDHHVLGPLGTGLPGGTFYEAFQATLDAFGLALLAGVLLALYRRLVRKPEHLGPDRKVVLFLLGLLFLCLTGFVLEGLRMALEDKPFGSWTFVGRGVAVLVHNGGLSGEAGHLIYKILWWSHAGVALGLLTAVPYTQLRHLLTSPVNIMLSSPRPTGALQTPFKLTEVIASGNFDIKVGASLVADFDVKDRVALTSCTNCGRCEEVCPAYATGTSLSPRLVVQSLKEQMGIPGTDGNGSRDLLECVLSEDEIWACTLCAGCTQSCPVLIDPPRYLVPLRRELVSRNRLGEKRTDVLNNLTRAFNPYGGPHSKRDRLAGELGVSTLREIPDVEFLYWIGCAATYDPRSRRIAEAVVKILKRAGVSFGILGSEERCTGDPARRLGEEGKFQELALQNVETFRRYRVGKIVTHCAHCFNTFRNEYPEFGGEFEVLHHTTLIHRLMESGKIEMKKELLDRAALHDSCYLARLNGITESPRKILASIPALTTVELGRNKDQSFCCGAGGANYWYDVPRERTMSSLRVEEAGDTGADILAVGCPFCLRMLEDASSSGTFGGRIRVRDLSELVAEAID